MGALFCPGEILEVRGDKVHVLFEDGSEEWTRIAALRFFREEDDDTQGAQPTKFASNQTFLESLRRGDRVWAPWSGGALFVGSIHDLRDDEAHIHFDDGDHGWVLLHQLLPFEPTRGMRVLVNWRMGGQYFPGVVTKGAGERVHIHYDDGDEEWTTPAALVMLSAVAGPDANPTKIVARGGGLRRFLWLIPVAIGLLWLLWRISRH
jgi:hypothetical protein